VHQPLLGNESRAVEMGGIL